MINTPQTLSSAVLVLCTYGSGSSAVAGILHHLGVMMGEKLIPASECNPKGHFEDAQFRQLLYQFRHDRSLLIRIEAFINNRFAAYPLWGVKEPAILEAILEIAPILNNRNYKVIVTNRDTDASVLSYKRKHPNSDLSATREQIEYLIRQRDQFLEEWSPEVLWINFNDLTDQPEANVRSILEFVFGKRPSVLETRSWPSKDSIQNAINSIDPSMNHRLENELP